MPPPWRPMYLSILTYDPQKVRTLLERRKILADNGAMDPKNEWSDLAGGRIFKLMTADPEKAWNPWQSSFAWNDLGKLEIIPVIETQHMVELLEGSKKLW